MLLGIAGCCSVLQCVAVCCSVLQCVAVCCRVLLGIAGHRNTVLQCVAVCCSALQCVTVCCSVFATFLNCLVSMDKEVVLQGIAVLILCKGCRSHSILYMHLNLNI